MTRRARHDRRAFRLPEIYGSTETTDTAIWFSDTHVDSAPIAMGAPTATTNIMTTPTTKDMIELLADFFFCSSPAASQYLTPRYAPRDGERTRHRDARNPHRVNQIDYGFREIVEVRTVGGNKRQYCRNKNVHIVNSLILLRLFRRNFAFRRFVTEFFCVAAENIGELCEKFRLGASYGGRTRFLFVFFMVSPTSCAACGARGL